MNLNSNELLADEISKINRKSNFKNLSMAFVGNNDAEIMAKVTVAAMGNDRLRIMQKREKLIRLQDSRNNVKLSLHDSWAGVSQFNSCGLSQFGRNKHHKSYQLHTMAFKNNMRRNNFVMNPQFVIKGQLARSSIQ